MGHLGYRRVEKNYAGTLTFVYIGSISAHKISHLIVKLVVITST